MSSLATPFFVDAPFAPLASIRPDASSPNQVWYFEGNSSAASSHAAIQIIFLAGAPFGTPPVPLAFMVLVTGTLEDGTYFETILPAVRGAEVVEGKGVWRLPAGEAGWTRDDESGTWVVQFGDGAPVKGVLTLKSSVPLQNLHHPSGSVGETSEGAALPTPLLAHGIGWSTAVPGASISFDGVVNGKTLKFDGTGFHDTNFAASAWPNHFTKWIWARGIVGQHTFVMYHFLPKDKDVWHTSAAVWKAGETLISTWTGAPNWTDGVVEVTKTGPWPDVPQGLKEPEANALGLRVKVGDVVFAVTSTKMVAKGTAIPYGRWIAEVSVDGSETTDAGSGSFDWFVFA